jgi:hypothetical protein
MTQDTANCGNAILNARTNLGIYDKRMPQRACRMRNMATELWQIRSMELIARQRIKNARQEKRPAQGRPSC